MPFLSAPRSHSIIKAIDLPLGFVDDGPGLLNRLRAQDELFGGLKRCFIGLFRGSDVVSLHDDHFLLERLHIALLVSLSLAEL